MEEKETGYADQVQRQKLISCLPSTFDIIYLIYQSRQRTVLTKQELIHKIIESNPKIVDKGKCELCFLSLSHQLVACDVNPDVELLNLQVKSKSK